MIGNFRKCPPHILIIVIWWKRKRKRAPCLRGPIQEAVKEADSTIAAAAGWLSIFAGLQLSACRCATVCFSKNGSLQSFWWLLLLPCYNVAAAAADFSVFLCLLT